MCISYSCPVVCHFDLCSIIVPYTNVWVLGVMLLHLVVDGTSTWNLIFGYQRRLHQKMVLRQNEQGFPLFFAKYLLILIIFQSSSAPFECSTLKNHQIWQKFGQKWRRDLFNKPFIHITVPDLKISNFFICIQALCKLAGGLNWCSMVPLRPNSPAILTDPLNLTDGASVHLGL